MLNDLAPILTTGLTATAVPSKLRATMNPAAIQTHSAS
jgi:hypothetical protein